MDLLTRRPRPPPWWTRTGPGVCHREAGAPQSRGPGAVCRLVARDSETAADVPLRSGGRTRGGEGSRQGVQRVRRRSRVFCPVRAFDRSDEAHPRPEGPAAVPSPPVQSWSRVQMPRGRPRSRARARVRAPWSRGQVTFPVTGGSAGAAVPVP